METPHVLYTPEAFVNRTKEIELVSGVASQVAAAAQTHIPPKDLNRTIVLHSERGSGKTFLSFHLQRTILPHLGVTSLLLCLGKAADKQEHKNEWFGEQAMSQLLPEDESTDSSEPIREEERLVTIRNIIRVILVWLAEQVGVATGDAAETDLAELTGYLVRDLKNNPEPYPLALIVDSVFEQDWLFLDELERYVLAPLAALDYTLIILTGRGQIKTFEAPALQSRVQMPEPALRGFTPQEIKAQLDWQYPNYEMTPEEIHKNGKGIPLVNLVLAQSSDLKTGLKTAIEQLLAVIHPAPRRERLTPYFKALAVLQGFRQDEIAPMLDAYFQTDSFQHKSQEQIRKEIRDPMLDTQLVHWSDANWVIDENLRTVLLKYLALDKDLWKRLNCRAYQLYQGWAKEFRKEDPEGSGYYDQLAHYHDVQLSQVQATADDCMKSERKD